MIVKTERNINDYTDITDMAIVHTTVRQWGRSLGIVIPRESTEEEHINAGDTVQIIVMKKPRTLEHVFGALKHKKIDTAKELKLLDKEGWDG